MKIASEYFGNRIKETTTTTGTGSFTLAGAVATFQTFNNGLLVTTDGVVKTTYYSATNATGSEWEVGIGTITNGTSTIMARSTVIASSNSNQLVNFSAGTKTVVATVPASVVEKQRASKDIIVTAGESLAVNDCLFIDKNDGKAYKAVASVVAESADSFVNGFALQAASTNGSLLMRITGKVTGFTNLNVGRYQYISNTAGQITETPPANVIAVGIATGPDEIYINSQGTHRRDFIFGYNVYLMGGRSSGTAGTNRCDRIDPLTDTCSANLYVSTQFNALIGRAVGLSNFNNKGYCLGGISASTIQNTGRILYFAEETVLALTSSNLSGVRQEAAGVNERQAKGYTIGGTSAASTAVATADRIYYNTDTTSAVTTANASQARGAGAGLTEGFYKGYVLGGYTGAQVEFATGDLVTFSNDVTVAKTTTNLGLSVSDGLGFSSPGSAGYVAGGQTGAALSTTAIDKITFATDVRSTLTTVLTGTRWGANGGSNGAVAAYICGGQSTASAFLAASNKFFFATEGISAITALGQSVARSKAANLSDVGC